MLTAEEFDPEKEKRLIEDERKEIGRIGRFISEWDKEKDKKVE